MDVLQVLGLKPHVGTDHTVTDAQKLSVIVNVRVRWPNGAVEDVPYGINPPTAAQQAALQAKINQAWDQHTILLKAWEAAYSVGKATLAEKPVYKEPEDTTNENRVRMAVQSWLNAGGGIPEWVPPTAEELRELVEPLSARQFRLGLVQSGRTLAQVDAAIAAIPDATDRATAEIEWRFATTFNRMHPLVVSLSAALGFTPEEFDALWQTALQL